MGCLSYQMPLTSTMSNIANLSLCWIPFMTGFYSKHLIIEMMSLNNINLIVILMMFLGIGSTSYYSARLTLFSMNMNFKFYKMSSLYESMNNVFKSIMILMLYSIVSGSLFSWLIFPELYLIIIPIESKLMTLMMVMFGIWLGYEISII